MISYANKNITSIQYNALNLPTIVTFADGSTLTNIYSADGCGFSFNIFCGMGSKDENDKDSFIPACFNADTKTVIIDNYYRNNSSIPGHEVIAEEVYHAHQCDNSYLDGDLESHPNI